MAKASGANVRHGVKRSVALFALPLVIILLLRLVGSLVLSLGWWGLDFAGYLPPWQLFAVTAIALLAALPKSAAMIAGGLERAGDLVFPTDPSRMLTTHIALAVVLGLVAALITMPFPFLGGDGVHVMRRLFRFNAEVLTSYGQFRTEPLTVLLYAGLAKLTGTCTTAGGSVDLTGYTLLFRIIGGVGAAVLAFIVLRFSRLLAANAIERLALASMALCTSGALLFFGYVEFYVPLFTASALFLFSGMRCARENTRPVLPALALLIAVAFHFSALAFVPALLYLVLRRPDREGAARQTPTAMRQQWVLGVLVIAGAVIVYAFAVNGPWIGLTAGDSHVTLFSAVHAFDVLNNVLLTAPMALAVLIMALPAIRRNTGGIPPALVFVAIGAIWWLVLIASQPAFALDWDIFAVFGLALACSASLLLALIFPLERRRYLSAQMIVQPLLFLLPWLLLHMNQDAAVARYAALSERYTGVLPPSVVAGFHETMRSEAAGRSDGLAEIRHIAAMIALTDDNYEYMKLLRALTNNDPGTGNALPEVRGILRNLGAESDQKLNQPVGEDAVSRAISLRQLYPTLVLSMGTALPPLRRIAWLEESLTTARRVGRPFAILAQLGNLAFDPGDFARAGKWYRAALRDSLSAPGDGGATLSLIHSRLGIMSFGKGANVAALASFMHATTYRSAPAVVWSNLGFALFRSARFPESASAFTTTLRMDSSDVNALYCLGRLTFGNPSTAGSGRWLLRRFLLRERNTARSADAVRMLAAG